MSILFVGLCRSEENLIATYDIVGEYHEVLSAEARPFGRYNLELPLDSSAGDIARAIRQHHREHYPALLETWQLTNRVAMRLSEPEEPQ